MCFPQAYLNRDLEGKETMKSILVENLFETNSALLWNKISYHPVIMVITSRITKVKYKIYMVKAKKNLNRNRFNLQNKLFKNKNL